MKISTDLISHSLLNFISTDHLNELIESALFFEVKENKFFENNFSPNNLIICLDGLASLVDRKSERHAEKIIPGRSLELQSLFLKSENSKFRWFTKTDCKFVSISFDKFKSFAIPDRIEYLQRITTRQELQNIKNSLRLFHIPEKIIQELITSFVEKDFSELKNELGICVPIQNEIKISMLLEEKPRELFTCQPGNMFITYQDNDLIFSEEKNLCWFINKESADAISEEIFNSVEILDLIKDKSAELKSLTQESIQEEETETEPDLDDGIPIEAFNKDIVRKDLGKFTKKAAIQQHDMMDCGAACMAMISSHYKRKHPIASWRNLIHITREGASMLAIKRGAEKMGFMSIGVMSGTKALQKFHTPFIALMAYHYVVVYEINDTHITYADPGSGLLTATIDEFKVDYSKNVLLIKPTNDFFKIPESKSTYLKYLLLIKDHYRDLAEVFVFSIIIFLAQLTPPIFVQFIFDNALVNQSKSALNTIAIVAIIVNLLCGLMLIARTSMMVRISTKLNLKLSSLFFRRILSLSLNYFMVRNVGDISSRISELENLRQFVSQKAISFVINIISLATYGLILYFYNINLFYLLIFFVILAMVPLSRILKKLMTGFREVFGIKSKMQSTLFELVKNMDTIISLGGGNASHWKWYDRFSKFQKIEFKNQIAVSNLIVFNGLFQRFVGLTFLVFSIYLFTKGKLSLGQVVAISSLISNIIEPVLQIFQDWDDANRAFVSLEKIDDLLTCKVETDEGKAGKRVEFKKGDITFKDVWFRYGSETSPWILKGINLTIKEGETVAFVGLSGSGKSTITSLINRLYEPVKGEVTIAGSRVQDIDILNLRENISMILQESSIFSGTVLENIAMEKEFSFEKVKNATEMSLANEFILKMKNGYSTILGEDGETGMSGGQKQRLNIARTIYKNPSLIIMDEATSALDSITEKTVVNNIKATCTKSTTIIIAHRLNTVLHADKIYVMAKGKIVEEGNHDSLLKQQGLYYKMFKKQVNL